MDRVSFTTRMYNRFRHILFSGFGTSLGKVRIIILSADLECAKKVHFGPWPKKVVHPCCKQSNVKRYSLLIQSACNRWQIEFLKYALSFFSSSALLCISSC